MSFESRLSKARDFEEEVAAALRRLGWLVEDYGQALLSERARAMLRGAEYAQHRWLPDLLAHHPGWNLRVLVDAKASDGPNYTIEKAALSALATHERTALMPLYIVFYDWHVARVCELWQATDDTRICRTGPYFSRGSGTPYWIFERGSLPRTFDNTFGVRR